MHRYQLAVGLNTRRFALVFGVNTFAALALNTIFTVVLIDKAGLQLDVITQFIVYRQVSDYSLSCMFSIFKCVYGQFY